MAGLTECAARRERKHMPANVNSVSLTGNLTRDAELRATTSGKEVLRFSVAVNDQVYNSQTGVWENHSNYVDCVLFGARATSLSHYLFRGTKVAVDGKLRYDSWTSKDGARRSRLEVMVNEIDFMSTRPAGSPQPPSSPIVPPEAQPAQPTLQPAAPVVDYGSVEIADQDILF